MDFRCGSSGSRRQTSTTTLLAYFGGYFFGNIRHCLHCLHSADKDQQESHAVAGKPHVAVVKFDTYRNLQRHRAILPVIARLSCQLLMLSIHCDYISLFGDCKTDCTQVYWSLGSELQTMHVVWWTVNCWSSTYDTLADGLHVLENVY